MERSRPKKMMRKSEFILAPIDLAEGWETSWSSLNPRRIDSEFWTRMPALFSTRNAVTLSISQCQIQGNQKTLAYSILFCCCIWIKSSILWSEVWNISIFSLPRRALNAFQVFSALFDVLRPSIWKRLSFPLGTSEAILSPSRNIRKSSASSEQIFIASFSLSSLARLDSSSSLIMLKTNSNRFIVETTSFGAPDIEEYSLISLHSFVPVPIKLSTLLARPIAVRGSIVAITQDIRPH